MKPFAALMLALVALPMVRAADPYPKPELLVEPAALAKPEEAQGYVILDARVEKKYLAGHIPGALLVDHAAWGKTFGDGTDADGWGKRIAAVGVSADSKVLVYDDNSAKDAARVWWILRYWGVKDVRLLNGGWVGWTAGKFMAEKEVRVAAPTAFKAVAQADRLATKSQLLKSIDAKTWQIVDARSEKEFCGTDALKNKKAGAMPGAKLLEWSDLIEPDTQRFKSAAAMKKVFADAGVKLDAPTATHCQGGGRASVMAYGMELMGATDVRNYYKSWGEWGNADDTPVVKPEPKKK